MKYFAHYAAASDDPKISKLVDQSGYLGYAIFFMLCERLAGMKKGPTDTQSYLFQTKIWAKRGANHTQTMTKAILNLARLGLIEAQEDEGNFIIKIPKLNNYMDENTKRRERELKTPRRRCAGQTIPDLDHTRPEKDLKARSQAPALGAGSASAEEAEAEDPRVKAQVAELFKSINEKLAPKDGRSKAEDRAAARAVEISRSEEPGKTGQPKTVDPALEAELVLTRADIVDHGIDPARANQIITLLAEYHSGRMEAHDLSAALDSVLTCHEKVSLYEVDGVIERRA